MLFISIFYALFIRLYFLITSSHLKDYHKSSLHDMLLYLFYNVIIVYTFLYALHIIYYFNNKHV